jgi:hypothetical protein
VDHKEDTANSILVCPVLTVVDAGNVGFGQNNTSNNFNSM